MLRYIYLKFLSDFCNVLFQISSLKMQIQSQESDLKSQEDDLNRAKAELNRLQQEETQLEQSIQAGKVQLETIIKSLKSTQEEINQVFTVVCMTSSLLSWMLKVERQLERWLYRRGKNSGAWNKPFWLVIEWVTYWSIFYCLGKK